MDLEVWLGQLEAMLRYAGGVIKTTMLRSATMS